MYIVENPQGIYYVGATEDLERRLSEHNRGQSNFTRGRGPWSLVYEESFPSFMEAHRRELAIKRKKRKSYIEWLIAEKEKIAHGSVV